MAHANKGVVRLDVRGLLCPLPLLRLSEAAARLSQGTRICVLSDDSGIEVDLPAWCERTGSRLESLVQEGELYRGTVLLGPLTKIQKEQV